MVPYLSELLDEFYKRPIEQRREEWLRELASAVNEIQEKQADLTPERLAENPEFVTVLHRATDVALRTREQGKRRALRNAIVAGMVRSPESNTGNVLFGRSN